jgi:Domain of unknown function (DUF4190)/Protein of unknown function (DUF2510)
VSAQGPGNWYADPTGRYQQRYHDGSGWTPHVVTLQGEQTTDSAPLPAQPLVPAPAGYYVPVYQPVPQSRTNGLAVASMVLGILWIWWVGSLLAVIFGFAARHQIAQSRGTQSGGGMATAGIVLGLIGLATMLWAMLVLLAL